MVWELKNRTPFEAGGGFLRDRNGSETWVVILKATFSVRPDGTVSIAERQQPVCLAPTYQAEPGTSCLVYETDLVIEKDNTDIYLNGCAHAPNNQPVDDLTAELRVEKLVKQIRVTGDRRWEMSNGFVKPGPPKPFITMPLSYDRAFGGYSTELDESGNRICDPRNHLGKGFSLSVQELPGELAPNLEYVSGKTNCGVGSVPASFGAIPSYWEPRAELAGTYDERWATTRRPLPPEDFDVGHNQCAPKDQQWQGHLQGGEQVCLTHLTPQRVVRFKVPHMQVIIQTRLAGNLLNQEANFHSFILEPEQERIIIVMQTSVPCQGQEHLLEGSELTCNWTLV